MRLGIVSDSHGHAANTRSAIRMLQSLEVQRVLHCGDIGTEDIIEFFAPWPTDFVFGNCDYDREALAAAITRAGQMCHNTFGELAISGRRIALLHGDDTKKLREVKTNGQWDLVCHGHTHVANIEQHDDTVILNPGALYRANPHSLAIVELPAIKPTIVNL